MISEEVLRARLFLMHATEPPAPAIHDFVAVHGPVDTVERIRHGTVPHAVRAEITWPDVTIDAALRALDSGVARLLTPEDDQWPQGILASGSGIASPLALWVRGTASLTELVNLAVAITGSRAASPYGTQVARDFSYDLAVAGVTVVTGGGLGVDDAAAQAALIPAKGRVVIAQPCGIDQPYPHQQTELFNTVVDHGGLVISEYPAGARPSRSRFPARARLLAMLSSATVIVEAGRRSGALAVAHAAGRLGRRVYAVPGSIYSATSAGTNELLHSGIARTATSAEHLFQAR